MKQLSVTDLSILLVEPSQVQRRIIKSQLIEAGIQQLETVADLADAKQLLATYAPDVVISSMYFENTTALELATYIQNQPLTENTAYILISSEHKFESLDPLRQAGVIAILPKPFAFNDMEKALKSTLDYIETEEINLEHYDVASVRVLVVDDSSMARKHISKMLMNAGIETITQVENGLQALQVLSEQGFDLIVTDYNMPEMDGYELVENIRRDPEWSYIPILMVTSEESGAKLNAVKQAGVSALLEKPFNASTIRKVFVELLND